MARITIEDCMEKVPNRFHLVRMASIRAKQLKKGALPLLTSEENKQVVMSLREIAAGLVKPGDVEAVGPPSAELERPAAEAPVVETAPETTETTETAETTEPTEETPPAVEG